MSRGYYRYLLHASTLMWKNNKLKRRQLTQTVFELMLPICLAILLIGLNYCLPIEAQPDFVYKDIFDLTKIIENYQPTLLSIVNQIPNMSESEVEVLARTFNISKQRIWALSYIKIKPSDMKPYLAFTPNNNQFVRHIMRRVEKFSRNQFQIIGFRNESMMNEWLFDDKLEFMLPYIKYFGVVFDQDASRYDKRFTIRIRPKPSQKLFDLLIPSWYTDQHFPFRVKSGPRNFKNKYGGPPEYLESNFLTIQHLISKTITETVSDKRFNHKVTIQRMPNVRFKTENYLNLISLYLPFIIVLIFMLPGASIVRNFIEEKQTHLTEILMLAGIPPWLNWIVWFVHSMFYYVFLSIIIVILYTTSWFNSYGHSAIFAHSNPVLIFTCFLVISFVNTAFSLFIGSIFNHTNTGQMFYCIIYILIYIPYTTLRLDVQNISVSTAIFLAPAMNTLISLLVRLCIYWEIEGIGSQWNNINTTNYHDDSITISALIQLVLLITALLCAVTIYINSCIHRKIFRGYLSQHNFPFTYRNTQQADFQLDSSNLDNNRCEYFESEPSDTIPGIMLKNVYKAYYGNNFVLSNVCLKAYNSQITALLGHTSSGKSTLLSIVCGLRSKNFGQVYINNTLLEDCNSFNSHIIGFCPQYNVFYKDLSVKENFLFFNKIKMPFGDSCTSLSKILDTTKLNEFSDVPCKYLSGGMKRRVSVGTALCGDSQIIVLDEPTCGVDPAARKFIWQILQKQKRNKSILITTHYLEEAEYLADKIYILDRAKMQCGGSPYFLKEKFGSGYILSIIKTVDKSSEKLISLINDYVPDAQIIRDSSSELVFNLPSQNKHCYGKLFCNIELNANALGVETFGVSITTIEEVFIRACQETMSHDDQSSVVSCRFTAAAIGGSRSVTRSMSPDIIKSVLPVTCDRSSIVGDLHSSEPLSLISQVKKYTGLLLTFSQLFSEIRNNILYMKYNKYLLFFQIILPVFFTLVSLKAMHFFPAIQRGFPFHLKPIDRFKMLLYNDHKNYGNLHEFTQILLNTSSVSSNLTRSYSDVVAHMMKLQEKNLYTFNKNIYASAFLYNNIYKPKFSEANQSFSEDTNRTQYIIGPNVNIWFNNEMFHSPAIAVAFVDNMLLKLHKGPEYDLDIVNHPLRMTNASALFEEISGVGNGLRVSIIFMIALTIVIAAFLLQPITERGKRSICLKKLNGLSMSVYYSAGICINMLIFAASVFLVLLLFRYSPDVHSFSVPLVQFYIAFYLFFYGLNNILFLKLYEKLFTQATSATTSFVFLNVSFGLFFSIIVIYMEKLLLLSRKFVNFSVMFFVWFPSYSLVVSMGRLFFNYLANKYCRNDFIDVLCKYTNNTDAFILLSVCCQTENCKTSGCLDWSPDYMSFDSHGIGYPISVLIIECVIFVMILIVLDSRLFSRIQNVYQRLYIANYIDLKESADGYNYCCFQDEDVISEIKRVNAISMITDHQVIVRNVIKVYGFEFIAVNQLSFVLDKGECFGLLGINGAGKTTLFKMLTGEVDISSGEIYILGQNLAKNSICEAIGYCSQFDTFNDSYTGREILKLYCRLRGIRQHSISSLVKNLSDFMCFTDYLDVQVRNYSYGFRQKLSIAVALIGNPRVLLLDEPTAGMDPVSCRMIWDLIQRVRRTGTIVIITSHSMMECENVCTKIAIMAKGKFRCFGSAQHLKSKYSEGYNLKLKIRPDTHLNVPNRNSRQYSSMISRIFSSNRRPSVGQVINNLHSRAGSVSMICSPAVNAAFDNSTNDPKLFIDPFSNVENNFTNISAVRDFIERLYPGIR